jgi:hypothetical protein
MFSTPYRCPDCGGSEGYRSRRRNFVEKRILPLLLLRPVRCVNCYRRIQVSMFVDVPERKSPANRRVAA